MTSYLGEILYYARLASLLISVLLIARMVYTYRRVRPVSRKRCLTGILFPVLILGVYAVIIGTGLPRPALIFIFLLGLFLGFWRGRKTKLWVENNRPWAQHAIWFLVIWGISYALMQVLVSVAHSMSADVGIGTMCFTTAIAVGSQGNILMRLRRLPAARPVPAAATAGAARPQAPSSAEPAAAPSQARRFCNQCGSKVVPGDRYCRNCGTSL